jgi:hypothetical protein
VPNHDIDNIFIIRSYVYKCFLYIITTYIPNISLGLVFMYLIVINMSFLPILIYHNLSFINITINFKILFMEISSFV